MTSAQVQQDEPGTDSFDSALRLKSAPRVHVSKMNLLQDDLRKPSPFMSSGEKEDRKSE